MEATLSHLYIIRGVSGAGKSTLAQAMLRSGMVRYHSEADQWMRDASGAYRYDRSKLSRAHELCLDAARRHLEYGPVAVSNTFTRIWEMQPYLDLGYPFTVIRCEGRFQNVHGVPDETVARMRTRFEDYPA